MWNLFLWGTHDKGQKFTFRKGSSTFAVLNQEKNHLQHCEFQMSPTYKPNVFQKFLSKSPVEYT